MSELLLAHEPFTRLSAFFGVFAVMALWEVQAPRRTQSVSKKFRWANNLALAFLNTLILRILFPTAAVGLALQISQQNVGLLNHFNWSQGLRVLVGVVALDLAIYLQHILFHAVPALWRLHRMHHADLDFDVTTGARFYPLEIALSMLIKFAAIAVLGPPALAVLIFEVLLNATAMFNHANVRMALAVDRVLRWFIVTPDMHRVHHSVEPNETNSNFGFNLSCWDRLLGTYRSQPAAGHTAMTIGIVEYRDLHRVNRLDGMLLLPFVGPVKDYAINRRHKNAAAKDPI